MIRLIILLLFAATTVEAAIPFPVAMFGKGVLRTNGGGSGGNTNLTNGITFHLRMDSVAGGITPDAGPKALDFQTTNSITTVPLQITNGILCATATSRYVFRDYTNAFEPGGGTALTINFWITNNTTATFQYLLTKGNFPTTFSYGVNLGNGGTHPAKIGFILGNSVAGVESLSSVLGNAKVMVTCVYDGSLTGNTNRAKIFINGVDDTSGTVSGTIPASIAAVSETLLIGGLKNSATPALFTDGAIDEVTIWNVALSASSIFQIYTNNMNQISYPWGN